MLFMMLKLSEVLTMLWPNRCCQVRLITMCVSRLDVGFFVLVS